MSDYTALLAQLREDVAGGEYSGGGYRYVEVMPDTAAAVIAAIEALVKERDQAIRDLDARFEHSDHLSAKYYQRMRAAEREMHARELHLFEEEQKSAGLAAEVERLRLVHAGQARLAMSAVFLADTDDDEGVQAFRAEWVKEHDARLIEGLADTYASGRLTGVFAGRDDYTRAWLRERARQVREGEA